MNLFVLDLAPVTCATYHSDQHMKMCLEAAQLISTAISVLGNFFPHAAPGLYKPTHYNHPCCKWVRLSQGNFDWAVRLCIALQQEKSYRGGASYEACRAVAEYAAEHYRDVVPVGEKTLHVIDINPKKYPNVVIDHENAVETYRRYYRQEKIHFATKGDATWTKRAKPKWLLNSVL